MAKIGREEFPELTLSQAVEIAEKAGRQSVKTTASLAQVMGLKSIDSGYFYHQVSALTKYFGVVNRTKDSVSLTPLGQRIAHPVNDADRRLAIAEAAGRVHLLQALFEALGQSFHEADFRAKLRDVTGATPPEIDKSASYLERLYRDAIPYIAQVPPTSDLGRETDQRPGTDNWAFSAIPLPQGARARQGGGGRADSLEAETAFRTFAAEGVYLRVKRELDSLEEADAVIRAWLDREKKRPRPNVEDVPP